MAEGLSLPDGTSPAVAVDAVNGVADFNRMLAQAAENVSGPSDDEPPAPPKRVPPDKSDPGYTPNPPRRGRPPKSERARTRDAKPGEMGNSKDGKLEPRDYRADLDALGEVIWLGASQLPWTQPFAPLINAESRAPMVNAWNEAANQNATVRRAVEKMTAGGGSSWVLGVAMASLPLGMGVYSILTASPETKQALREKADADLQAWARAKGLVPDTEDTPEAS